MSNPMRSPPQVPRRAGAPQIRVVQTAAERDAIAHLRYDVYVAELGRNRTSADHVTKTLREPLDDDGVLFGAFTGDARAVGTLLIAPSTAPSLHHREIYGWEDRERVHPGAVCHASKLIVSPEARGTMLSIELIRAGTRDALRRGWRFCFLGTYENLVSLYSRVGFVLRGTSFDPVHGEVRIMEWDLHDLEHLRAVRSPMLADAVELLNHPAGAAWDARVHLTNHEYRE